jgi:hypothetical protein
MALRPGSFELGLRRSEMIRLTYDAGEMSLVPRHFEKWFRTDDLHYLSVGISDAALTGSAQQSVEGCILGGFLESDEFGLSGC